MPAAERQAGKNARDSGAHRHRGTHQDGVSDIDACTQGIPGTRLMASRTRQDGGVPHPPGPPSTIGVPTSGSLLVGVIDRSFSMGWMAQPYRDMGGKAQTHLITDH
jgi:hypothetical protein